MKKEELNLKPLLLFIFLILFGFTIGNNKQEFLNVFSRGENTISAKELERELGDKEITLINVHTPYEGEISGTDLFIDYDSMKANASRLPKDKNERIVLYCKSGRMSETALKTLQAMGYTNVSHLGGGMNAWEKSGNEVLDLADLPEDVLPEEGFSLPVSWGDLGPKLIASGVLDGDKFEELMRPTEEERKIVFEGSEESIKIDSNSSRFVVNMLWAAGLAQKSIVYEEGPLGQEYKDDAGSFASTGGWTLARGDATSYLNRFKFLDLDDGEEARVAEISKNMYRPCCGNNTWFPDCNHGMAALFAIELMVDGGLSDEEIYKNLLSLNSFWFPQNYLATAVYFGRQGVEWEDVDAKEVLGAEFSSAQGAAQIYKKVGELPFGQEGVGGSCGA